MNSAQGFYTNGRLASHTHASKVRVPPTQLQQMALCIASRVKATPKGPLVATEQVLGLLWTCGVGFL